MIYSISSDLTSFKTLRFNPGMNILITDREISSSVHQTRNRAGKSSFIEILHFILGADCDNKSIFKKPELYESTFLMDFDCGPDRVTASRSGSDHLKVFVNPVPVSPDLPIAKVTKDTQAPYFAIKSWRTMLGILMFHLGAESENSYSPKFRQLISYFARRIENLGFSDPTSQSSKQQEWDKQVAISFLIGLDWRIPQSIETNRIATRDAKSTLSRSKSQKGTHSAAALRSEKVNLQDRIQELREAIAEFTVLPEFREFEAEATELTLQLGSLSDANVIDKILMSEVQESLRAEGSGDPPDIPEMYSQLGTHLPDQVVRRFQEVQEFHLSVIRNRRSYLEREITEISLRIAEREEEYHRKDERRSELMRILHSHGALDQYAELQMELSRLEHQSETISALLDTTGNLEQKIVQLELEKSQIYSRLRENHTEQSSTIEKSIRIFGEFARNLYEDGGMLVIDATENGPSFEFDLQGGRSRGIGNMKIFCFDLMLARLCADRGIGPGFLIHDSHLFDGVDERQVARALQLAAKVANTDGFQYIVTLNSDSIPSSEWFESGFDIDSYMMQTVLDDRTIDGGLFGIRF